MHVHVHVGGLHLALFLANSLVVPTCYMYMCITQMTLNQLTTFSVILANWKLHEACVHVHVQYIHVVLCTFIFTTMWGLIFTFLEHWLQIGRVKVIVWKLKYPSIGGIQDRHCCLRITTHLHVCTLSWSGIFIYTCIPTEVSPEYADYTCTCICTYCFHAIAKWATRALCL